MRQFSTLVLIAALGLLAPRLAAQAPAPAPPDLAALQGTWGMISGATGGMPLPASYVQAMERVFTGNELTVTMAGSVFFKATVVLDTTQSPRAIDYHMTAGATAGALQLGIYTFAGDTLQSCFGAPNAARPTEFKTEPGDGRTLARWVRIPPQNR